MAETPILVRKIGQHRKCASLFRPKNKMMQIFKTWWAAIPFLAAIILKKFWTAPSWWGRRTRDAEGVEFDRDAEAVEMAGNWDWDPLPSRLLGLRSVVSSLAPQRGPGRNSGEKRFYYFLSVSERLSLQRLLKINVVHSPPLIEKKWVYSVGICSNRP